MLRERGWRIVSPKLRVGSAEHEVSWAPHFLDRLDWAYTESVAATLRKWDKEETLERLVRLVRALRPEVIVTMNPAPSGLAARTRSVSIVIADQ